MDYWLYGFSLLGFFLVPGALGRWVWLLPGIFSAVNLFLLFAPEELQPRTNFWIYFALSQAPWLLLGLDLLGKGRASRIVAQTPLRPWLLWPLFRLMGIGYLFAAYAGDLSWEFAFKTAFGEIVIGLGAVGLWAFHRPENALSRGVLFFWNAYGLITALTAGAGLLLAHPGLPFAPRPSLDLHGYFAGYPHSWIPLFWLPLAMVIHLVIFFKTAKETQPKRILGV